MATTTQVFSIRERIKDPAGFISFVEVANLAALPAAPASQTAYLITGTGTYYSTTKTTGATATDYTIEPLRISDTLLSSLIDTYGEDSATCRALKSIIGVVFNELLYLRKNTTGADTTEYQALQDVLNGYKYLLDMCTEQTKTNENNDTGRYRVTLVPTIGGGNL